MVDQVEKDEMVSRVEAWLEANPTALAALPPETRETLSDCAEFLADINGDLALRCEAALVTAYNPNERLREALEACRAKFREYEGLHTLKLRDYKGKEPLNYAAELQFKINRNREMAELCDAALALTSPSGLRE